MTTKSIRILALSLSTLFLYGNCSKKSDGGGVTPPVAVPINEVDVWLTKPDQSALLQKQADVISFSSGIASYPTINVDSATTYQTVDGFGYTFTGSSAYVINRMDAASKAALLNEFFGSGSNSLGVNYIRISIGASDLSPLVFSCNDMPAGQTDITLTNFSLSQDSVDLIPLLKQVIAINPGIKILATPWSPPAWMKSNTSPAGGSLLPQYYSVYAKYFVKYIQAMQAKGITIDAITPQNEPENPNNNPSMLMTAAQQTAFIKNDLGPAFQAAGINTKIILFDHNCDNPGYPIAVLNDAGAKPFINGSAFHLYAGDISALSTVYNAHPDKAIYFTEQFTSSNGNFGGDLKWHFKNVVIGSMRNWSRNVLEWNLANDATFGPHTIGGCTECKGAVTVVGSSITRNVAYYIIAQASRFVPPGSVRIASNLLTDLPNVAFKTPSGKKVLIVLNEGSTATGFNIGYKGKTAFTSLAAGAVATYNW
jgi:glucosylceramidase